MLRRFLNKLQACKAERHRYKLIAAGVIAVTKIEFNTFEGLALARANWQCVKPGCKENLSFTEIGHPFVVATASYFHRQSCPSCLTKYHTQVDSDYELHIHRFYFNPFI